MELIQAYQRKTKIDRLHYITMESIINRLGKMYEGEIITKNMIERFTIQLKNEMLHRGLDRYFQVELNFSNRTRILVHEINIFNPPKECVIWNL